MNGFNEKFELEWVGEIRILVKMEEEGRKKKKRECRDIRRKKIGKKEDENLGTN